MGSYYEPNGSLSQYINKMCYLDIYQEAFFTRKDTIYCLIRA
jgi:hypothetical protein